MLLLGWPAGVARDGDGACAEAGRRYFDEDYLEGYPAMVAVRALSPVLYQGVAPFLDDPDTRVAEAALSAALAFAEPCPASAAAPSSRRQVGVRRNELDESRAQPSPSPVVPFTPSGGDRWFAIELRRTTGPEGKPGRC
ncbi:hypothetical protein ABZW30_39240 [Kitasatospora sp. NPDC004669]|uniref:hypothetical protein n=1 Tax=Kitasatospora sp. NPDC004669 TaxID=3154555 RepID=UPI0033BC7697